jgi:hypothetical protein
MLNVKTIMNALFEGNRRPAICLRFSGKNMWNLSGILWSRCKSGISQVQLTNIINETSRWDMYSVVVNYISN